ncbi:MAG: RnfABCDGE type electron transport complex subunit D [Leptolyngbyaceae cyanobacterium bins.302]|nr:RnfABCDGE type electron transport complex subunit D [Leptolyngbyaceae cyanobacterium bins.302]
MLQDARIYQILFLSSFLLLGISTRDWTLHPEIVLTAIATCTTTQLIAGHCQTWIEGKAEDRRQKAEGQESGAERKGSKEVREHGSNLECKTSKLLPIYSPTHPLTHSPTPTPNSLFSPLITSLGLSLLLRTDHITTMMLAAIAAILSKFVVRMQGKHIFNPANMGIVAAILLTHDAWVSPGQWGEESWFALLFLGAGGVVVGRVGRWDTTIAFLIPYAVMEAMRNLWLGWTWDVWLHRLMSGSLLLFALFMVTDPRSIPNARTARILWAVAIALLTFILRNVFFVSTAVFWALFALSPLTLLLDVVWQAPRFLWQGRNQKDEEEKPSVEVPSQKTALEFKT